MSYQTFVLFIALPPFTQAIPTHSHSSVLWRHTNRDSKIGNNGLSTEAIIGVIGVVVAILGIAFSLAWSKRTKSPGRLGRALCLPTADGMHSCYRLHKLIKLTTQLRAVYPLSNRPTQAPPFITSQAAQPWHLAVGGDERMPQQQQCYYIQYERMIVHRLA